jgi:hypothetical protein
VNPNTRAWLLLLAVAAVCGGVIGGLLWYHDRNFSNSTLLRRLPVADSLVVGIDFAALRSSGILKALEDSKVAEEPEYQAFVQQTDFNWEQDLDGAILAFAPTGKYLLVRGRFDWKSLQSYVAQQGGDCYNAFCSMKGSADDRQISFFPLQRNLMGMAVSPDSTAALRLQNVSTAKAGPEAPDAPLWLSVPVGVLKSSQNLPEGTRMFATGLGHAQSLTLTLAPDGNRFAARMTVACRNEPDAADVALELTRVTQLLRDLIARENQKPSPSDLSGVLTSGTFHPNGKQVNGYWPIERSFIQNVLGK